MIFNNDFDLGDRDFLDENNQIRKYLWKDYWRFRELDPETKREVRYEKAATKKRIHQRNRRNTKGKLKQIKDSYSSN
jgi:hypothetical protein